MTQLPTVPSQRACAGGQSRLALVAAPAGDGVGALGVLFFFHRGMAIGVLAWASEILLEHRRPGPLLVGRAPRPLPGSGRCMRASVGSLRWLLIAGVDGASPALYSPA